MKKVIVGVFAHPDDESFGPAGTLILEHEQGTEIHLITLTAGEAGVNPDNVPDLATIRFGQTSTTGDTQGEITESGDRRPESGEVTEVLKTFVGEITQVPPAFSAIKINGQRAYKLARAGKEVDMPSRIVTIRSLELIEYAYPELRIRTHVSSGTYIRTLAEDIGKALATGAYCSELRRTKVGDYSINDAVSIAELKIDN